MQPLAEVLAFAFVSQQQHLALEKFRTMESMADMSFSLASEVNGALQGVIGQCGVVAQMRPELAGGLDAVVRHAERTLTCSSACDRPQANVSRKPPPSWPAAFRPARKPSSTTRASTYRPAPWARSSAAHV